MPTAGGINDYQEFKDVNANVVAYVSANGEFVTQFGQSVGPMTPVTTTSTIPSSASTVQVGAIAGAITLTLPAASSVTPGRELVINDGNGSISSSATVALKTPASGGKIGGVAANTASTSAAPYAFINAAWGAVRLISDGVNWNPF